MFLLTRWIFNPARILRFLRALTNLLKNARLVINYRPIHIEMRVRLGDRK